ncbi:hypothetical protein NOCARDAX2BIS_190051 [Nocardioides sp. AX2bis]|nr:hypothetical protein NOCARDAX2BIS_190051 [Nocardioides sp. AX2bis]
MGVSLALAIELSGGPPMDIDGEARAATEHASTTAARSIPVQRRQPGAPGRIASRPTGEE